MTTIEPDVLWGFIWLAFIFLAAVLVTVYLLWLMDD